VVESAAISRLEVGIRELRAHLSRYVKRVEAGEEILVTDRGKPVARMTQADRRSKLEELIAAGIVEPAPRRTGWLPEERVKAKGSVSELVEEQRR
jgi:prevent-host-death family protein